MPIQSGFKRLINAVHFVLYLIIPKADIVPLQGHL